MAKARLAPALMALALALPGCGSTPTATGKAGNDQEIAKNINWELRKDARLEGVTAYCVESKVTIEGRVSDPAAREEALRITREWSRGVHLVDRIEVRPR